MPEAQQHPLLADDPGAGDARSRLRTYLREDAPNPEIVATLASLANLKDRDVANLRHEARVHRENAEALYRQEVGRHVGEWFYRPAEAATAYERRIASDNAEEPSVLLDALELILRLDPADRATRIVAARAKRDQEQAELLVQRNAERPPLNVMVPGVTAPAIARRSFRFGPDGRQIENGEHFDAAGSHWRPGKLRAFLQLGSMTRFGAWADPDPEHLAECEHACAINESARLHTPRADNPAPVTATPAANDGRVCEACGDSFVPKRTDARYCGDACRQRAHRERRKAASLIRRGIKT